MFGGSQGINLIECIYTRMGLRVYQYLKTRVKRTIVWNQSLYNDAYWALRDLDRIILAKHNGHTVNHIIQRSTIDLNTKRQTHLNGFRFINKETSHTKLNESNDKKNRR